MCGDTDIYYMYTMYECILKIMICTVQYIYVQVHNYVGIVLYMYIRIYIYICIAGGVSAAESFKRER